VLEHAQRERIGLAASGMTEHPYAFVLGNGLGLCLGRGCDARRHLLDDLAGVRDDRGRFLVGEAPLYAIALGVSKRRDDDRVVHGAGRVGLQVLLEDLHRLVLIAGEEALIEPDLRLERRLVGDECRHELQAGDVLAEHGEADGERVAMIRPKGPQSQVQNATATSRPTCEKPAASA
jgi:hypothetical protein